MSYILDGLKKSERERQRGSVPELLTIQDIVLPKPKKRSLWPYLLVAALLLNVGILAVWVIPWQSKKTKVVAQSQAVPRIEEKAVVSPSPAISPTMSPGAIGTKQKGETGKPKQSAQAKAEIQKKSLGKPAPSGDSRDTRDRSATRKQTLIASHAPPEPRTIDPILPPPENKIYNLDELPLPLQKSLPGFVVSFSIYSDDPNSRMAKINGKVLREGDYLNTGLKVEEIAQDGVIFSFQSYRFRVVLK